MTRFSPGGGEQQLPQHEEHRRVEEGEPFAAHRGRRVDLIGDDLASEREFVDPVDDEVEEQIVQTGADESFVGDEGRPQLRALRPPRRRDP